ncbi:MAG: type II toxin-antitoxin system RelE/ParE family toxin [Planctomycetaceae bacterium]|nr:type II toxin-antitoxin system RelE/ParE family toxin [Planctomycetales bacterium]MCB9938826.1 type II toxin-antitoxin system RelE/ParE family toxin [Planctomycetaceae bacterium]
MYTVILTEPADSDVDDILQWLEDRSLQGAKSWLNSYQHAIQSLSKSANSFGLAPESADHREDIREFTFSTRHGNTYRLVFILRDDIAYILRVRGTGQSLLSANEIQFPE